MFIYMYHSKTNEISFTTPPLDIANYVLGRFGQQIRNTWKVLKCGAGEGWRRSVGPIM
jgi:hypothetical protein